MSNLFVTKLLTRRNIVQIVYQNEFQYLNNSDYYLSDDYDYKGKDVDKDFFIKILNNVFNLWNQYDQIFADLNIDIKGLSLSAIAIIKVAIAEFKLYEIEKKHIIPEYLKLSEYFLDNYEIKILNKILEIVLVQ